MKIKIINKSDNKLPAYQTEGSSGMDLHAFLEKDIIICPMQRALVPTGLYIECPVGYEAQVRSRSGLAANNGIFCLNSPGTVDSDYRGEIKVILMNLSERDFIIKNNDRIAQLVFCRVERAEFDESAQLIESSRGEGGFGHTGR
jgi:dUTP pyrophosphatase